MRAPPRNTVAAAAAALCLGAVGCAPAGPDALAELLELMPASAAARGLYYSDVGAGPAFGSVLPLRGAEELLDVELGDLDALLETGGSPLTVAAGTVRPGRVAAAVEAHGYEVTETDGWTVFERAGGEPAGGPLGAAVPAGAARRGTLVLGDPDDVRAAVAGRDPTAAAPGAEALVEAMGEVSAAAILLSPGRIVDAARTQGGVEAALERAGASAPLPAWDAAALTWSAADADGHTGAVWLALPAGTGGHDVARTLVLRAATAPLLGDARRPTSDLFERGPPRWDPDSDVVQMPVRWAADDPAAVRAELEAGSLLFLAPSA